jgi:dienelactone hydrolase
VAHFAELVAGAGFTVLVPHLFGVRGREPSAIDGLTTIGWACVSREFTALALRRTSPVTEWLRALARAAHDELGGPGVGAVGMCFTGGFALAMMVDDAVVAPVLSQPSLPFALTGAHRRDVNLSDADLARVKERAVAGTDVLGFRFTCDRLSPSERFARLREELGDRFIGVEIDSSPGNPYGLSRRAHSVLTGELVEDDPDHPTRKALDQVLDFFRAKLH